MPLPPLLDAETVCADAAFAGAVISPDGTKIAYLAPRDAFVQVWVRGIDEDHEDARCVTRDRQRGIRTFYWTEDPCWLLYRQDQAGNEDWHLYRVDLDDPDKSPVDLTPLPPGGRVLTVEHMRS